MAWGSVEKGGVFQTGSGSLPEDPASLAVLFGSWPAASSSSRDRIGESGPGFYQVFIILLSRPWLRPGRRR